jgi:uncharacterized membrane protein
MNSRILLAGTLALVLYEPIHAAKLTLLPDWFDSPDIRLFMLPDGQTFTGVDDTEVFRWSIAEGRTAIGTMPRSYGPANVAIHLTDVSDDGSTFIGKVGNDYYQPDFGSMWTAAAGMLIMPDSIDGTIRNPVPTAVSGDGDTIVGVSSGGIAFRWTPQRGTTSLGFTGSPSAISADGNSVVGSWAVSELSSEAFRWTESGGAIGLGFLPSEWQSSSAWEVSDDGQIVVGGSFGDAPITGPRAFIWTEQLGLELLTNRGNDHYVSGMSADGGVVIGLMRTLLDDPYGFNGEEFVWRRNHGLRTIAELIDDLDLGQTYPISDPQKYEQLYEVSADGNILLGASVKFDFSTDPYTPMIHYDYWLLDLSPAPEPESATLLMLGSVFIASVAGRLR